MLLTEISLLPNFTVSKKDLPLNKTYAEYSARQIAYSFCLVKDEFRFPLVSHQAKTEGSLCLAGYTKTSCEINFQQGKWIELTLNAAHELKDPV